MPRLNLAGVLQGTFIVWITVVTFRYTGVIFRSLRTPISPGTDVEWLTAWVVAAVVMAILAAGFRSARTILPIILVSACFIIMILSGTLQAGGITIWVFAVSHYWGRRILRFVAVQVDDWWESIALSIPVGLIIPALAGFAMGAANVLSPRNIWLTFILLTAPAVRWATIPTKAFVEKHQPASVEISFPLLVIVPVVLLNFLWAVAPEIQYDANNYHMAVGRIYLSNSGFENLPYFFHSYFFRLAEMLFTLGLALQGPAAAKFMSFGFGLISASCVFVLGRLAFDTRTGAWAAALFYTTPIVSWLCGTADNDLAVAMFLTAALIAFLKSRESREREGWLYVTGLLAGATVATKIDGAFGLVPLFALSLLEPPKLKTLIICALLLLAVLLPWYAITFYWTGNPVFPLLNGLFKSPLWALENRVMNSRDFGIGTGFAALARLPFRLVFDTSRFGEAAPGGTAGIALLLAFPFSGALLRDRKQAAVFLIATSVIYLLLWSYSFQYLRYYTQILPVICTLAAATMFYFRTSIWLAVALILQFAAAPPQFWNIPERFPLAVALGYETREHFLERTLEPYAAVQYLNKVTKPGDRVLGVDTDYLRFYLNAPMDSLVESTLNGVLVKARSMPADRELADTLRQAGFTYILTTRSALTAPASWYPYLQADFLNKFGEMVFRDSNAAVYRLKS